MNLYKITQSEWRTYTSRHGENCYTKESYVLASSIEEAVYTYRNKFPNWSIATVEVLACGQGDVGVVVLMADSRTPITESKSRKI